MLKYWRENNTIGLCSTCKLTDETETEKIKGEKSLFSEWDVLGLIRVRIKAHLLDYLNIHF